VSLGVLELGQEGRIRREVGGEGGAESFSRPEEVGGMGCLRRKRMRGGCRDRKLGGFVYVLDVGWVAIGMDGVGMRRMAEGGVGVWGGDRYGT